MAEDTDDPVSLDDENTSKLRYPISNANEIPNWMMFDRKVFKKLDMFSDATITPAEGARQIVLPLPPELYKNFKSEWGGRDMGVFGNFVRGQAGSAINKVLDVANNGGESKFNSYFDDFTYMNIKEIKDKGVNIAQSLGSIVEQGTKAYLTDQALDSNIFRNSGAFSGLARNPYKAITYETPSFRNYTMQYKMMAKNYQEAVAIKEIVKEFSIGAAPDFADSISNDIYKYPDMFAITIVDDSFLFKISPCVLDDLQIEYHGEGTPIYIAGPNGEQIPASVKLTLQFRETVILTKQDFIKNGA